MPETELREQINAVVEAREASHLVAEVKKTLYDEWLEHNAEFLDEVVSKAELVTEAEAKLKELTLQAYAETGNKAPAPGVGIREVTRLEYEPKEAFEWALEHRIALQLNKTAFDKLAKTAPETRPAFVKITTEPQATIATELERVE